MKTVKEKEDTVISCTMILHYFCNIAGYANIEKTCIKRENLYKTFFIIIKAVFVALSIYSFGKRFEISLTENVSGTVYLRTKDLLTVLNLIGFYVHTICNSAKEKKIRRFWLNLRAIEKDFQRVGIVLNHKRLRTTAAIGAIPEYIIACIYLTGYAKMMWTSGPLEEVILDELAGKNYLNTNVCTKNLIKFCQ